VLKLWGRANSINVHKVLWTLDELKVPYERVDAGLHFGVVNTPEYRAMNPNGRVPTIDDDGFILWESNAIVRYLAARHGAGTLWPTDVRRRADADRWMDWITDSIAHTVGGVFLQLIRTPAEKRDPHVIEVNRKRLNELFPILDKALAGREYIAGDTLTIGDIPIGVFTHRWLALEIERVPTPNLVAYYERLKQRPHYRAHVVKTLT
jgi:glutathione S-transferase